MITATVIYFICIFALMLHYQQKINKLKKRKSPFVRCSEIGWRCTEETKFSVHFTGMQAYYDGHCGTEQGIRRFAHETAMEYSRMIKDEYERYIYGALWDKLVTDDRTKNDNWKIIKVELRIPYIQMNEKSIEARIYE